MPPVFVKLPCPELDGGGRCLKQNVYNRCVFGQIEPADGGVPLGAAICTSTLPEVQCVLFRSLDR